MYMGSHGGEGGRKRGRQKGGKKAVMVYERAWKMQGRHKEGELK